MHQESSSPSSPPVEAAETDQQAQALELPSCVKHVRVDERNVYLVGTAHVSKQSVEDVRTTVEMVHPDTICVELCPSRHRALIDREGWRKMDIMRVIRERKTPFLLAQLILSSFYRKLGDQLGIQPGADMAEGVRLAKETGAHLVLADREVEITLKRTWRHLGFIEKFKMVGQLLMGLIFAGKIDDSVVESLKQKDQMEILMDAFADEFPQVKRRLIDERDLFLAQKIREAPGQTVVAVVGAGHMAGIEAHIHQDTELAPLTVLPPKSSVGSFLKWAIPIAIVVLIAWGFLKEGQAHAMESAIIWVALNSVLAGLGAVLAWAHPLTVLTAMVASPFTSLNPMIAAGFVAGFVQAVIRRPTVADLEDLPQAITSLKGFWTNPLCRILLVVALVNLGSSLAAFISGGWIAARTF
ncbi:TraB/GumN family protein [Desulfonatronum sp. SC1]|uniref:TraB/GumN family protein n=1 Tax=Desulfonatronum sp. SC1 TaxID=2109626 RepID=UPI000D30C384|nr:TraB/GumN family protein [Desulfonatronum sp. SC1]PTN33595.1 TraB family protein [Desulfonatronum sp. SC1]